MEERITLFYTLHNNKWFHIMNYTLEVIKTTDDRAILIKYGYCFFDGLKPISRIQRRRKHTL